MPLLVIIIITFTFIFSAFISNSPDLHLTPLYAYYINEVNFFLQYWFIFTLGFVVLIVILVLSENFKKHELSKRIFIAAYHILIATLLGFLVSFVVLFSVATIQLNILSITTNANP